MESRKEKKLRRRDKLTARTTSCCRETGDHVHYPPTRLSRSTRPHNAPSPNLYTGFESYFRITGKARYGECRKNQAAATGSTAYDGCGEFVSATAGDDSANCAACGCHRSFHCEESISYATNSVTEAVLEVLKVSSYELSQIFCSPYGGEAKGPSRGDRIAKDRSGGGDLTEEEEEAAAGRVKRLKTKFTAEQTEKMRNFAEKLRWKVSHERREEVDEFCVAIGVKREKFRIWMNNHKEKN